MEDPISYNPPPPNPNSLQHDDVGLLLIPPMDQDLLAGDLSFPEDFAGVGDGDYLPFGVDFEFTFDDISFADDLLLEPESDLSQDRSPNLEENRSPNVSRVYDCSFSQHRSPNLEENRSPNVARVYDCLFSQDRSPNLEENRSSNVARVYDCSVSSEESNFGEKLSCPSPEFGSCKSNSGLSHDSGNNSDRDVSSGSFISNNGNDNNLSEIGGSDREIKVEEIVGSKKCMSKRKKEQEQGESSGDDRTSKFRRSLTSATDSTSFNVGDDEDEKRTARLMRNRESAQLSRQRKKQYVEELEDKVRAMHSTITELNSKISYVMAENATLRLQFSGGAGVYPPPPPGMYPVAPMPYPWMPCPPYMVKPQGSQVPLIPIPRLKPQKPASPSKVSKKMKSKKNEGKTKKVASISFLGFLFFFLLFGGLVPMVNVRYGGVRDGFNGLQKGAVFMVDNHVDRMGFKDGKCSHGRVLQQSNKSDGFGPTGNSSDPLIASLYVPRNDKLVKIDGNLIIHSVLASEKAMASHMDSGVKTSEETSLAIARSYSPYPIPGPGRDNSRHPHLDGNPNGRQRALGSGSSDQSKASGSDGKLQQWFREGLAGPMLSSGMCTEVFQFDTSPALGSIVPATSIYNTTSEHRQNSTRSNKPRNRRILHEHPIPLDGHTRNFTEEHVQPHEQNVGFHSNKSHSSMIVSVLVDPREASDGDGEGVIQSKTLSRIFVVVLIDGVKYVTYSCMLPFVGSGNHLVTN